MSRYIDADDVLAKIDALQDKRFKECGCPYDISVYEIVDIINACETVDAVPKWIPCSERMPEEDRYVLMCFKRTEFAPECVVLFNIGCLLKDPDSNEQYWDIDDCFELHDEQMKNVVAWMPLPEYRADEVTE